MIYSTEDKVQIFQVGWPKELIMNVVELREFYQGALGQSVQRRISAVLSTRLAPHSGQTVLGLGYAHPYLEGLVPEEVITLSFMLARQGVIHWPPDKPVRSALVEDCDLPLLESVADYVVVAHGLEHSDGPLDMLQEIWRVLAPQGKLILIVPNRQGLWSASDASPFGYGQPFSRSQITNLLKEARFTVTWSNQALFLPPATSPAMLRIAPVLDRLGSKLLGRFSGVLVVEAMKQVYAFSSGKRSRRLLPRMRPVLLPSPQPFRRETTTTTRD